MEDIYSGMLVKWSASKGKYVSGHIFFGRSTYIRVAMMDIIDLQELCIRGFIVLPRPLVILIICVIFEFSCRLQLAMCYHCTE